MNKKPLSEQFNHLKFENLDEAINKAIEITKEDNLEASFYYNSKDRTMTSPLIVGKAHYSDFDEDYDHDQSGEFGEFHTHPIQPNCYKPSIADVIHWLYDKIDEAKVGCTTPNGEKHIQTYTFKNKEDVMKLRALIIPKEVIDATTVEVLDDIPKKLITIKGKEYIQTYFSPNIITDIDTYIKERSLDVVLPDCKTRIQELYQNEKIVRDWDYWKPTSSEFMYCMKEQLDEMIGEKFGK